MSEMVPPHLQQQFKENQKWSIPVPLVDPWPQIPFEEYSTEAWGHAEQEFKIRLNICLKFFITLLVGYLEGIGVWATHTQYQLNKFGTASGIVVIMGFLFLGAMVGLRSYISEISDCT